MFDKNVLKFWRHFLAKIGCWDLDYGIKAPTNCSLVLLLYRNLSCSFKEFALSLLLPIIYKCLDGAIRKWLLPYFFDPTKKSKCHPIQTDKKKQSTSCKNYLVKPAIFRRSFAHLIYFSAALLFLGGFGSKLMGNPKITIVWGTSTVGSSELLKDAEGNPLSAGVRGNGDGDLVELGYFSSGSTSDPFAGDWIPLTRGTHVGDSSSGYGFNDGMFIFTTTFEKNRDFVIVFPTEPKEFEENLGFTITSSTPAPGTPVCIRFYDKPSSGGANYNTVTGTDWLWPSFPDGSSIPSNRYFKISNSTSSSWSTGAIFEDPTNPFKTSLSPTYFVGIKNSEYSSGSGTFSDINGSYAWGTEISITATPGPHTYFYQWWGTGISEQWNETTSLTVDGAQTIYAEFAQEPYVLHLETNENGEVSGNGTYYFGDSVPIYAFPNYGYSFSHWEKNGSHYSSNANETVSIEGDLDLRAIFTRNTYEVLIGADFGGARTRF